MDVVDASFRDTWMEVKVERQPLTSPGLGQAAFRHPLMSTPTPNTPPTPRGMLGKGFSPIVSVSSQQLRECGEWLELIAVLVSVCWSSYLAACLVCVSAGP